MCFITYPHFTEYKRLKINVTDEGGEKHVYDVTGCKSGCNMNRFWANVKEKMRIRNASGISDNQVFLFWESGRKVYRLLNDNFLQIVCFLHLLPEWILLCRGAILCVWWGIICCRFWWIFGNGTMNVYTKGIRNIFILGLMSRS